MTPAGATRRSAWVGTCRFPPSPARRTRGCPATATMTLLFFPAAKIWCPWMTPRPRKPSTVCYIACCDTARAWRSPSPGSSGAAVTTVMSSGARSAATTCAACSAARRGSPILPILPGFPVAAGGGARDRGNEATYEYLTEPAPGGHEVWERNRRGPPQAQRYPHIRSPTAATSRWSSNTNPDPTRSPPAVPDSRCAPGNAAAASPCITTFRSSSPMGRTHA